MRLLQMCVPAGPQPRLIEPKQTMKAISRRYKKPWCAFSGSTAGTWKEFLDSGFQTRFWNEQLAVLPLLLKS